DRGGPLCDRPGAASPGWHHPSLCRERGPLLHSILPAVATTAPRNPALDSLIPGGRGFMAAGRGGAHEPRPRRLAGSTGRRGSLRCIPTGRRYVSLLNSGTAAGL